MSILRKPVPGRRVTLPAESILASYYMRKKLTHLPERTALADALHDYGPFKSDDDDDGSENVAKKMNFRSFKVNLFGPAQYVKCRRLFLELN